MRHPRTCASNIIRAFHLILIGLLLILLPGGCSDNGSGGGSHAVSKGDISPDETEPTLTGALRIFKSQGLFGNVDIPASMENPAALNGFLKRMDPNAVFLTPEEYAAFRVSHKANYVGVGMEIEKRESGEIVCFPMPGSPAQVAGIEKGDGIETIDGRPVGGRSVYVVASWLMGADGSRVSLSLSRNGAPHRVELVRKRIEAQSVTVENSSGLTVVKIHYFNSGTRRQLQFALEELQPGTRLVLDLRDNPGGDLYKSIDAAMLFLEKETLIVTIESRDSVQPHRSTTAASCTATPLVIWQNENTASAAEVFIAALTENSRAVSIGTTSFGKGTTQKVEEFRDGSALVFTTGYLLTPKGTRYYHQGLKPTRVLEGDLPSEAAYIKATERIFEQ